METALRIYSCYTLVQPNVGKVSRVWKNRFQESDFLKKIRWLWGSQKTKFMTFFRADVMRLAEKLGGLPGSKWPTRVTLCEHHPPHAGYKPSNMSLRSMVEGSYWLLTSSLISPHSNGNVPSRSVISQPAHQEERSGPCPSHSKAL